MIISLNFKISRFCFCSLEDVLATFWAFSNFGNFRFVIQKRLRKIKSKWRSCLVQFVKKYCCIDDLVTYPVDQMPLTKMTSWPNVIAPLFFLFLVSSSGQNLNPLWLASRLNSIPNTMEENVLKNVNKCWNIQTNKTICNIVSLCLGQSQTREY